MMENAISESVLFVLTFALIFWYLQFYWKRQQAKQLTGLSVVPFIGDAIALIKYYSGFVISIIKILFTKNPDWFGPAVGIFVKDPADAEIILTSQKTVAKDMVLYKATVPFFGGGLFSNGNVTTWRRDRKLLSPMFSQKNSAAYFDIFRDNSNQLIENLRKEEGKGAFDVYHYVMNINLKTICETSLGLDINSDTAVQYDGLSKAVERVVDVVTQRLSNVWYFLDFTYNLLPIKKLTEKTASAYNDIMNPIIDAGKKRHYEKLKEKGGEDFSPKKAKYLLEDLLTLYHDGGRFTDEEMRDHINTVIFAGFETSAATISFVMVLLGIYPDIQEKVYQEIVDVVGTDGPIEYEDLKNFQYMEQVFKETLRNYPVGPYVARITEEELQLSTQKVPAGSSLIIAILNIQKDPKIWPNPNKFDPDRFLPEEVSKRHPYSWIPFSAGPRNCIGIRYAWISLKIMLATMVREYHIKANYKEMQDIPMTTSVLSKPKDGYLIEISRRKNK